VYWSEVLNRDIIDMDTGTRIGVAADVDFVFDEVTGAIRSFLVPGRGGPFGLFRLGAPIEIPWSAVHRVGPDAILVRSQTYKSRGPARSDTGAPPVG